MRGRPAGRALPLAGNAVLQSNPLRLESGAVRRFAFPFSWMTGPTMRLPLLIALASSLAGLATAAQAVPAGIIPAPAVETPREGAYQITSRTPIIYPPGDTDARAAAQRLAELRGHYER